MIEVNPFMFCSAKRAGREEAVRHTHVAISSDRCAHVLVGLLDEHYGIGFMVVSWSCNAICRDLKRVGCRMRPGDPPSTATLRDTYRIFSSHSLSLHHSTTSTFSYDAMD